MWLRLARNDGVIVKVALKQNVLFKELAEFGKVRLEVSLKRAAL
jgi:hypothetical protein